LTSSSTAWELFVVTAPGLEGITAGELEALGLRAERTEPGGLLLQGGRETLWTLNLRLRTASRILVRVARFRAVGFRDLERRAREVPWHEFLPRGVDPGDVAFDVTCRKSRLYHSGAVEQRLRDALAEATHGTGGGTAGAGGGPAMGGSPGGSPIPGARFVARLHRNRLTLSADASGIHLHRRGYREAVGKAPLRETLAAAMLLAGEWGGEDPLLDPFCGSGTIPIEAALLAHGIPPGLRRRFAFEAWPGAEPDEGERWRRDGAGARPAGASTSVARPSIVGSDRDEGVIGSAEENAGRAGVQAWVEFTRAAVSSAPFPGDGGTVVTNPPYGHRVGEADRLRSLYQRLGDRLRSECAGGRVILLSANRELTAQLRLDTRVLFRTRNGGIPVEAVSAQIP
jgi:putative N6-adenine-specific DNA methylase